MTSVAILDGMLIGLTARDCELCALAVRRVEFRDEYVLDLFTVRNRGSDYRVEKCVFSYVTNVLVGSVICAAIVAFLRAPRHNDRVDRDLIAFFEGDRTHIKSKSE